MDKITRIVSNIHARLIRATGRLGSGSRDGAVLVLTHVGARSGKVRQNPLMFFNHEGGYVIVASYGGSPKDPAWYYNLKAHPEVTVLVSGQEIPVTAHPIETGPERDALYARMVELNRGFGAYQQNTERTIPVVKLVPRKS